MRAIEPIDIFRFYVTYKDIEAPIIDNLRFGDIDKKQKTLKAYLNNDMTLGRNFASNKHVTVFQAVKSYSAQGGSDITVLSGLFFEHELLTLGRKSAIFAASRLLWLFNFETIIIDVNNKKALNVKSEVYEDYCNAWRIAYIEKEPEIIELIEKHQLSKIDPIFNEKWFRMRVFDQYLWKLGKA